MTLNRSTLSKIDARIRSLLDHEEGVQLVKVPVSDAVWSTWRRYCETVGIPMGRALAVLLHQELGSVVAGDLDRIGRLLDDREAKVAAGETALAERERSMATREKVLDAKEKAINSQVARTTPTRSTPGPISNPGRNEPCWCASGKKFKFCHGRL